MNASQQPLSLSLPFVRVQRYLFYLLLVSVWGVISLSNFTESYRQLLFQTSRENGFYEWLTVLVGLSISVVAFIRIRNSKAGIRDVLPVPLLWLIAIAAIIGSMEEISWGQHIFGFESQGVFEAHNLQKETNIHNFVKQDYVNLVLQGSVYFIFVLIPLLIYLDIKIIKAIFPQSWLNLRPSLAAIGVFITSCCFQDYFRYETMFDTALLWCVYLLFGATLIVTKVTRIEWLVFLFLSVTCVLTAVCDPVFEYNNMQYEIRELFILLGFLFWFSETVEKPRRETVDQS